MTLETISISIPFCGFYNNLPNAEFDSALDQLYSDDNGNSFDNLVSQAFNAIDWRKVHLLYAQAYATVWLENCEITGATFDELYSPKFHNYSTDEIYCNFTHDSILAIFADTDKTALAAIIKKRCTSRNGFASFYSPEITDWPVDPLQWEPAQLALLIECYSQEYISADDYIYLMESYQCNGYFDQWLLDAMPADTVAALDAQFNLLKGETL